MRQTKVIPALKRFLKHCNADITLNDSGICGALVTWYFIAASRSKKTNFFAELRRMSSLKKRDYDKDASELAKYCRDYALAFNPLVYIKSVQQNDFDQVAKMFGLDGIYNNYNLGLKIKREWLLEILRGCIHDNEMVSLAANGHMIGLHCENNQYYVYNSNSDDEKCLTTLEDVADEIVDCLCTKLGKPSDELGLEMRIFSRNPPDERHYPKQADLIREFFGAPPSPQNSQALKERQSALDESLYLACKVRDSKSAIELLKLGARPFVANPNSNNHTAFEVACALGINELVKLFLTMLPTEEDILTGLKQTIDFKQTVTTALILDTNSVSAKVLRNNTATVFDCACRAGDLELVKKLYQTNPEKIDSLTLRAGLESTALMQAAENGQRKVVEFLLSIDIVATDQAQLNGACKLAIKNKHHETYLALCKSTPSVDTLLPTAIASDNIRVVEDLVKYKNIIPTLKHIKSAILYGNLTILCLLLNCEYLVPTREIQLLRDICSEDSSTSDLSLLDNYPAQDLELRDVIDLICQCGNKKFLDRIKNLPHIKRLIIRNADRFLLSAAKNGHVALVDTLRAIGASFTDPNSYRDYLSKACENDNGAVATAFVSAGLNPYQTFTEGIYKNQTAIDVALMAESAESVLQIIKKQPPDKTFRDKIILACSKCDLLSVLETLLPQDQIEASEIATKALKVAAKQSKPSVKIINYLLGNKVRVNDSGKLYLLDLACRNGHLDILSTLSERCNINQPINSLHPLEIALQFKRPEVLLLLLEKKADIRLTAEGGKNIFLQLCALGYTEVITKVLQACPAIKTPGLLTEALHIACSHRQPELANLLIAHGAEPGAGTNVAMMFYQAYQDKPRPISPLQERDVDVLAIAYKNGHYAIYEKVLAAKNYLKILSNGQQPSLFINSGIKILGDFGSTQERLVLARKLKMQHEQLAQSKMPLLDHAVKSQQPEIAYQLLRNGVDLSKTEEGGRKALLLACVYGYHDVVREIINKKDFYDAKLEASPNSDTPLKIAAAFGNRRVVGILLHAYQTKYGQTADAILALAIQNKEWHVVAAVLEVMLPSDLSQKVLSKLQYHRQEIKNALLQIIHSPLDEQNYHADAKHRLAMISLNQNALGKLLHTPVSSFLFKFSLNRDSFNQPITRSISSIREKIQELETPIGIKTNK